MLELYRVLTDTTVKQINEESSNNLSPIFIDIPTLEGGEYLTKFELLNVSDNIRHDNITLLFDTSSDPIDPDVTVKMMVKSTPPTKDEIDALSNYNSITIDKLEPQEFVILWIYISYPGANELNLPYSIQHTYNNSLIINSTEVTI